MKNFGLFIVVALTTLAVAQACVELPDGQECPPDGLHTYPDTEHCSMYWECYNGCGTHMTCTKDYLYDDVHKWCEEPEKIFCGERDCDNRPCKDAPTNGTFDCPMDGHFVDPDNCIKYYNCYDGLAEHVTCRKEGSSQLCFDPINDWCNWCASVECNERPICDVHDEQCQHQPEHSTHKPTKCDQVDCSGEGFVAEGDCENCFCQCSGGHGYEICCESGLLFNAAIGLCDWPYNMPKCD